MNGGVLSGYWWSRLLIDFPIGVHGDNRSSDITSHHWLGFLPNLHQSSTYLNNLLHRHALWIPHHVLCSYPKVKHLGWLCSSSDCLSVGSMLGRYSHRLQHCIQYVGGVSCCWWLTNHQHSPALILKIHICQLRQCGTGLTPSRRMRPSGISIRTISFKQLQGLEGRPFMV